MQHSVMDLAFAVSRATEENIDLIEGVMRQTKLLAINARVEAARAGTSGSAFAVVAQQMGGVAEEITRISKVLRSSIRTNTEKLEIVGTELNQKFRGTRFTDLALNAIEIIDRNLYERSCDVRWWATDSAVVEACATQASQACDYASQRLATILRAYTVYLDLWVADAQGKVIASGRGAKYRSVQGSDVSGTEWFRQAMQTRSGDDFIACNIATNNVLADAQVATYATAIREGGAVNGRRIGALGIFFDWAPQAHTVVNGIALTQEERSKTCTMLVDQAGTVIASSMPQLLGSAFQIKTDGKTRGYYIEKNRLIAFALTPGYEPYKGLGWYGVIDAPME